MNPETVWAVRINISPDDTKGTLSLEEGHLVFTIPEGSLRIPFGEITKVKRIKGSPVLLVDQAGDKPARFAFFFIKPPSLVAQGRITKRRARKRSTAQLSTSNRLKKDLIQSWEKSIRDAIEASNEQSAAGQAD